MASTPADLAPDTLDFLTEHHLATLATLRADGTPHVVAVGFTWDPDTATARVITSDGSQKVRNAERAGYAAVTQIDGPRWLTLEGKARVLRDPDSVRDAEHRYARRYRVPRVNPKRVVVEIAVTRVLGSPSLRGR
ncbi:MAG TPA: PPOX class F420-dependent oxidoreductase [Aldersonia sp.]